MHAHLKILSATAAKTACAIWLGAGAATTSSYSQVARSTSARDSPDGHREVRPSTSTRWDRKKDVVGESRSNPSWHRITISIHLGGEEEEERRGEESCLLDSEVLNLFSRRDPLCKRLRVKGMGHLCFFFFP